MAIAVGVLCILAELLGLFSVAVVRWSGGSWSLALLVAAVSVAGYVFCVGRRMERVSQR